MTFSQRIGRKEIRKVFQIESIDRDLENLLWNNILTDFIEEIDLGFATRFKDPYFDKEDIFKDIWINFFKQRIDEIPSHYKGNISDNGFTEYIKMQFFKVEWYEKYDLIEFLSTISSIVHIDFVEKVNSNLKQELAGYSIIDNKITPIISECEIQSIESTLRNVSKYDSVETHISQAIKLLSDRKNPDYRNSVKESISAVEAYCRILINNEKATLGQAIKKLESKSKLHEAMKSAFSLLYGYTSDSGGIRHSLTKNDTEITIDDAKFMLVSCSAFINYSKSIEII